MLTRNGRGALVGGAVFLVVGIALGYEEVGFVGVALLVAVVSGFAWVGARARVEMERRLDRDRVTVGDVTLGVLTITNSSKRTVGGLNAYEQIGDQRIVVPVPRLAPGQPRTVRYQLPTTRRCVLEVGPLRLVRSDPFGLVRFEQAHGDRQLLYVHPRRHILSRLPPTLLRSLDGPTSDTAPRGSVVFHALREYVAGDDRRHIHWRSTARLGQLMVRQHVDTSLPNLTVVLDATVGHQTDASFEEAVEVVASVMTASTQAGFPTRLLMSDGQQFAPTGAHATQQILDYLAGIALSGSANLTRVLEGLRSTGDTLVIVARELSAHDTSLIAARRSAFRSVIVATVDPGGSGVPAGLHPGVQSVHGSTGAQVVGHWNAQVRS